MHCTHFSNILTALFRQFYFAHFFDSEMFINLKSLKNPFEHNDGTLLINDIDPEILVINIYYVTAILKEVFSIHSNQLLNNFSSMSLISEAYSSIKVS